jgi:hypothetical protein
MEFRPIVAVLQHFSCALRARPPAPITAVTGDTPKNLANAGPDSVDDYLRVWFRRRKGAESERGRAYISLVGPRRLVIPLRVRQPRR